MTVADRVLAVVGRVVEIPQHRGDGPLVGVGRRHGAHVLQIDRRPAGIDVEVERGRAGHDRPGHGLIVVGIALAPSQPRGVHARVDTGQRMRAAGVLVATELVVGKVTPLVDDDRVVPFVGAGRIVGDDQSRPPSVVERAGSTVAALPKGGDGAIHDRRVGRVVVPEAPRPIERIGDIEDRRLGLIELVDGQVEIDVAALGVDDVGIPAIELLLIEILDRGDQAVAVAHLGADAEIKLQLVIEEAVVVAKVEGELAVGVGDGVAVGVVGDGVFLAHLDQDVMDGHGRPQLVLVAAGIERRHTGRQPRFGHNRCDRHAILAGQDAVDIEASGGGAIGWAARRQMGLVDSRPGARRRVDRRARVQVRHGGVARAHVEEQHPQRGQRGRPIGEVERPGADLMDAVGEARLPGERNRLTRTDRAERLLGRAAEQFAAIGQFPLDVDIGRGAQRASGQGQGDGIAGRGGRVGRQRDLNAVVGAAGTVDEGGRELRRHRRGAGGRRQDERGDEQHDKGENRSDLLHWSPRAIAALFGWYSIGSPRSGNILAERETECNRELYLQSKSRQPRGTGKGGGNSLIRPSCRLYAGQPKHYIHLKNR